MGGASLVEDTATGNPVVFSTDVAKPLVSLKANFLPVQSGTGDPSPTNIRPITGWTGLDVGQINGTVPDISNNSGMGYTDGQWKNVSTDGKTRFDAYIQLYKGSTYIKGAGSKSISASGIYSITFTVDDGECNRIVFLHSGSQNNLSVKFPFSLQLGTYTISLNVVSANPSVVGGLAIKDIFLVEGSEVERNLYPVTWQTHGTIYGGYVDLVTGEVWATWIGETFSNLDLYYTTYKNANAFRTKELTGIAKVSSSTNFYLVSCFTKSGSITSYAESENKPNNSAYLNTSEDKLFIKATDYTTVSDFLEAYGSQMIVYKISTPTLITTLTPQQINALKGNNTVWSDANGDCEVTYLKKG